MAALCLLAPALQGAEKRVREKIEFSESTNKVELPKAEREQNDLSSYSLNPLRPASSGSGLDMERSQRTTPDIDLKKAQKLLDKQKNWMFADPDEMNNKDSEFNLFDKKRGDKKGSLFEEEDNRSTVETYWDNREASARALFKQRQPREKEMNTDRDKQDMIFFGGNSKNDAKDGDAFGSGKEEKGAIIQELNVRSMITGGPDNPLNEPAANRYGKNALKLGLEVVPRPQVTPEQQRQTEAEDKLRAARFSDLIRGPRGLTPTIGVVLDPVNSAVDSTRQDFNPIAPALNNSPFPLGINDSPAPASAPALPGRGVDIARPDTMNNYSARLPSMPSIGALAPSAAPVISTPRFTPSPALVEVPRRKF